MATARTPWTQYGWPRRQADWSGLAVITRTALANGWIEIPAGSAVKIAGRPHKGTVRIEAPPCPHCGVKATMSRVSWLDLKPIA